MKVRSAVPADLKQCVTLDHHTTTTRVWQMNRREENNAVFVSFHSVRLPRAMRVLYPRDPNELWNDWRQWDSFLVAEEDGYVHGYIGLLERSAESKVWIRDLVVGRPFRQKNGFTRSSIQRQHRLRCAALQRRHHRQYRMGKSTGFG